MSESYCAIFNYAEAALRYAKDGNTRESIRQLQRFVLPALAENAIASGEVQTNCGQWDELIKALKNAHNELPPCQPDDNGVG